MWISGRNYNTVDTGRYDYIEPFKIPFEMSTVRILASCHFFGNVRNFNAIYTVIQSLIQNEGISLYSEIILILVNHPC